MFFWCTTLPYRKLTLPLPQIVNSLPQNHKSTYSRPPLLPALQQYGPLVFFERLVSEGLSLLWLAPLKDDEIPETQAAFDDYVAEQQKLFSCCSVSTPPSAAAPLRLLLSTRSDCLLSRSHLTAPPTTRPTAPSLVRVRFSPPRPSRVPESAAAVRSLKAWP